MAKECVLFALLVIMFVGCTVYTPVPILIEDTAVINAPFDEVWVAAVSTIADTSLPIEVMEKDSGLITTKFAILCSGVGVREKINVLAIMPSYFLDVWSQARYTLSIFLVSEGEDATKVKVTTHIEAFERNVATGWHVCYSRGIIESRIINSVRSRLQLVSGKWPKQKEAGGNHDL